MQFFLMLKTKKLLVLSEN